MGFWDNVWNVGKSIIGGIASPVIDLGKKIFTKKDPDTGATTARDFSKVIDTVGNIATAAAPVVGTMISADSAKRINQQSLDYSRELFDKQKVETDTSHVREVADLKAAGLNPILSARYGGSAVATGAMPNLRNPYENAGRDLHSAASVNLTRKMNVAQIKNTQAQTLLNSAVALKEREKAAQAAMETDRMRTTQPAKTSRWKGWIQHGKETLDVVNPLRFIK